MNDLATRVRQIITAVLKLDAAEQANLAQEVGYKQLRKWTSAKHAEIMVAIEDAFELEIDGRDLARLNDVAKIVAYLRDHGRA